MPTANQKMIQLFSSLADETRLNIVLSLLEKPQSVNEIHDFLRRSGTLTLSAVSHQLKYLEMAGVVTFKKDGRTKLFRLSDKFCWCILKDAQQHCQGTRACQACKDCQQNSGVNVTKSRIRAILKPQ